VRISELRNDRVIVRRVVCAVAGTVAVVVGQPPLWVLGLATFGLVALVAVESTTARRRSDRSTRSPLPSGRPG